LESLQKFSVDKSHYSLRLLSPSFTESAIRATSSWVLVVHH